MTKTPLILLGAGGHAKVLLDLIRLLEWPILGVCDPVLHQQHVIFWRNLPVLGNDTIIDRYSTEEVRLVNGIGSLPGQSLRRRLHDGLTQKGYQFATLIHPTATVSDSAIIGQGVQIMAGVTIQADARIGNGVILNTGVQIDHDCLIDDHVHIAPGTVLSGDVSVSEGCHIGVGATLIQGVQIGTGAIVGAGTTVIRNIPAWHQQTGQPARQPQEIHMESKRT